ncbi:hypothetical protein [Thalassotalea atypica]|uniref:hypothetical protein n=1 Tax=Thalassotalea atypica TaxID=2054316 RepID=UPI002573DC57|nr:hypothetical protein [Thalassotalea atypica]
MKNSSLKVILPALVAALVSQTAFAADTAEEKELQDMSDPLAVFSQFGVGYTDRGLNIKYGKSYDPGVENTMAMNIVELKGFLGEDIGFSQIVEEDNSIDSFRFRNFKVDMTNGRGNQIDIAYDIETDTANASYSFIQALPKWGRVQFFPILGAGVTIQNDAIDSIENGEKVIDEGYSMTGTYTVAGMYSKVTITDNIWFNYNPMFLSSLSGSDFYKDNAYGMGNSDILLHEVALSYQINPRSNVRYFANFSDEVNYKDGEHRIEYNYQF